MIGVYADWEGLNGPRRIGSLHSRRTRARELFEFQYDSQALDLELAREVAEYFSINLAQADEIIADFRGIVSQWRILAQRLALPFREQEQMADAFRLADR